MNIETVDIFKAMVTVLSGATGWLISFVLKTRGR